MTRSQDGTPLTLNSSGLAGHASLINLKNRLGEGSEWPCLGNCRSERSQGPCAQSAREEVRKPPGGPRGQDCGGETQGRSGRGGGQLMGEPGANNGLIKERVRVRRSRAGLQPVNLLSPPYPMEQLSSARRELEPWPGNCWVLALRANEVVAASLPGPRMALLCSGCRGSGPQ